MDKEKMAVVYEMRESRRNITKEFYEILGVPRNEFNIDFILFFRNAYALYRKNPNEAISIIEYYANRK